MLLIRRFEERSSQLYGQGLIGGFCHLYIGQEAVVAGLHPLKQPQDTVITAYRDHGHMLACGMDPKGVMAELLGRKDGYSKGKGGSMHMFSKEKQFYGGHGIVGAQVSIGTGMALAHKYKKDNGLCMIYMGDGATNQGQVHESFNMSALWGLPALYIIEDNGYAMGTSVERHAAGELQNRGMAFGIPGVTIDGMDVLKVQEEGKKAMDYVRTESKPYILHVKTYRYRGHSMSDPATYRNKDEVEEYRLNNDPITNLKKVILEQKIASEEDLEMIDTEIKLIAKEAADWAKESPEPDPSELYTDVEVASWQQ